MSSARQTTDHGEIRRWIEERDLAFLHQDRRRQAEPLQQVREP